MFASGHIAVAAAVQKTTDSAQTQSDRHGGRDNVGHLPSRDVVFSQNEIIGAEVADQPTDRGAVKHQSALPDVEKFSDGPRWVRSQTHKSDSSTNDATNENPNRQVLNALFSDSFPLGPSVGQPWTNKEGYNQHKPEAINR